MMKKAAAEKLEKDETEGATLPEMVRLKVADADDYKWPGWRVIPTRTAAVICEDEAKIWSYMNQSWHRFDHASNKWIECQEPWQAECECSRTSGSKGSNKIPKDSSPGGLQ